MLFVGIDVFLGESEVQNENPVTLVHISDSEVVWLYISMDYASRVDVLDSFQHLQGTHECCLKRESAFAELEETFQRRP